MKKNSTSPFIRKIVYIAIIGGLLIPLSMISRPEVADAKGQLKDEGGRLSKMRRSYKLAQASISEIDPTSEAMKLASMGLRGVAVNILWMQALEHQKNEDYDKLAATLQTLTKIQPNFVKVWEYQGHNLAFNVSMEFDDYEYRYEWVKKGLEFLKGGIAYNVDDHRMTDNMGFFTGTKFGKSDEKRPFRRIFRKDKLFHNAMSDYIAPDSYDAREYGPDSYMMAWQWYDESQKLVDNGALQYKSDLMFNMNRPSQKRQQAMILSDEFRSDEVIREIWEDASDEWEKYGNIELRNASNVAFSLERDSQYESKVAELRLKLDKMTPGARVIEQKRVWKSLGLAEEEYFIIEVAPEELDDQQRRQRRGFINVLNSTDRLFDVAVAGNAAPDDQLEAVRIAKEIVETLSKMSAINKDGGIINYSFWNSRNAAESTDAMIRARQSLYDALEMHRKSIFEDEYVYDYVTGEKRIQRAGAATLYEEAFEKFDEVMKQHRDLIDTPVIEDLVTSIQRYQQLLLFSGKEWPDDFVLQWMLDERAELGTDDKLPTSEQIKERMEDMKEVESENAEDADSEKQEMDADGEAKEMKAAEEKKMEEKKMEEKKMEDEKAAEDKKMSEDEKADKDDPDSESDDS